MANAKIRFSTADTKCEVRDIRSLLLGQRVANVYDLNERTYVFKFAVPGQSEKILLLLESGIRFHTTKYARDKSEMPSPFCMKLRRHIRTRRLEDVKQLCGDRIVDFKFGSGDSVYRIILELYANGNIVLTDGNYEILALLRSHQFEEDVAIKVGEIYPIKFATSMDVAGGINAVVSVSPDVPDGERTVTGMDVLGVVGMNASSFVKWALEKEEESIAWATTASSTMAATGKKAKAAKKMTMRQLLLSRDSGLSSYGAEILDHCLLVAGVKSNDKVSDFLSLTDTGTTSVDQLLVALQEAPMLLKSLDVPGQCGYVIYTEQPTTTAPSSATTATATATATATSSATADGTAMGTLVDFVPRLYKQHEHRPHQEFPSFNEAVDEYFCKFEEQKMQKQASTAEATAKKKVEQVRGGLEAVVKSLEKTQRKMEEGAMLMEVYHEDVDKCILVISSAVNAGMSWDSIAEMVAAETAAGNPIASLVVRLRLDRNLAVLRLRNLYDEDSDNEEDEGQEGANAAAANTKKTAKGGSNAMVEVEVDLSMSAHANARRMYGHKKVARAKEEKTIMHSERALQQVEEQTTKSLEAQKIKRNLQAMRKVHWFEKFNWFVTSEGYLVLSGRDAQQNEALVKRYLSPGDVYVHAELHGASSCIVRAKINPETGATKPISPFALQEAGTMTCCRSNAWTNKVVTSAWWVFGSQVSKTAPSGEYLPTGSFMIYGRKNFLPPMALEMGFGVMFRLDDASVVRHAKDRKDRPSMSDETSSVFSEAANRYGIEFEGLGLKEVDSDGSGDEGGSEDGDGDDDGEEGDGTVLATIAETEEGEEGDDIIATRGNKDDHDDDVDDDEGGDEEEDEDKEEPAASVATSSNTQPDSEGEKGRNKGKGRMSAKERQLLKKGSSLSSGGESGKGTSGSSRANKDINHSNDNQNSNSNNKNGGSKHPSDDGQTISKGNKKGASSTPPTSSSGTSTTATGVNKTKKLSKKKARRYADQDDEDRELAMMALGHATKVGERMNDQLEQQKTEQAQLARTRKQQKAGVQGILKENWNDLMLLLTPTVREAIQEMVQKEGGIKAGEIDSHEIKTLASFSETHGLAIVRLFSDGDNLKKIGNKSGFLAGIMRRYSKEVIGPSSQSQAPSSGESTHKPGKEKSSSSSLSVGGDGSNEGKESGVITKVTDVDLSKPETDADEDEDDSEEEGEGGGDGTGGEGVSSTVLSRRERKKQEAAALQQLLEEEGILDEDEGKQADEIDKITGRPVSEDVLLYAVPVCGPYAALNNFKYKVKLTPGTGKKGKAAKQAVDVFTRMKECTPTEKALMRALTDPEMVAIMIGDVKLSMPGLYQAQRQKKVKK